MENAILYIRVSTDEQADKGFSLRDQEQKLQQYCNQNLINVVKVFREDYSAKTFNRPEFKKLMQFCKSQKDNISKLLFLKWDRFSRNTLESYQMINTFNNLGIVVNAIEQPLDLNIPEQGLMLAVYLSMPEVENQRRSLNVKAGIRRALKEGRYVLSAPKGYKMRRDKSNKPILIPNDDAPFVREAFELMSNGIYNQKEVLDKMKAKGFKTSRTALARILRNPLYKGDIIIDAFGEEPKTIVKGIHEPLISSEIFNRVQNNLNGKKKQFGIVHKKLNPKFPLKGFVLCPSCGNQLQASTSKGRNKYYSYYHCAKPCNTRYSQKEAHLWMQSFLKNISLKPRVQKLFIKMIEQRFAKELNVKIENQKSIKTQIKEIERKVARLQDLFIDGDIAKKDYLSAKLRYENMILELKNQLEKKINENEILNIYKEGLKSLQNIDIQYFNSALEGKRLLIGSIFPEKFQFENKKVRTADINPILLKITSINEGFETNKKWDKSKKNDLSHLVLKAGLEPARA